MNEKVKVIVRGDSEGEHTTYIERNGRYFKFYANEWEGTTSEDIILLLTFLGHEVFEIHNKAIKVPEDQIVNRS